jgi:hypothetical protein
MGREVSCAAVVNGRRMEGRALLETDALVFRGDERLSIPYKDMADVQAEQGRLTVVYPHGTAVFDLGREAEKCFARAEMSAGIETFSSSRSSIEPASETNFSRSARRWFTID